MIITVANQKGGVGKTTTAMNIGVALAKAGKKVLLIDSDPQANLTSYLGVATGANEGGGQDNPTRTLDEAYLAKRPMSAADFITPTASGVDLIAADKALSGVEFYLFSRGDKEKVLAAFIEPVRAQYDFILIDTPPSMNLLTLNALCCSDRVLVPVQPEFFSLEGIVKIRESIEEIRGRWNPNLAILGVLPTQVSHRRKLTGEVIDALRGELGDIVFENAIHDSAAVTESSGHACSVMDYDRKSRGAKDYTAAAQELLERAGAQA